VVIREVISPGNLSMNLAQEQNAPTASPNIASHRYEVQRQTDQTKMQQFFVQVQLTEGQKVGLPMNLSRGGRCHGDPSPRLLQSVHIDNGLTFK
jgi:hypothetical protein